MRKNCDYIQFYSDPDYKNKLTEPLTNEAGDAAKGNYPKEIVIEGDTVYYHF
jgi:hypothetical protein